MLTNSDHHKNNDSKQLNFSSSIKENLLLINSNLEKSLKKYNIQKKEQSFFSGNSQIQTQNNQFEKSVKQNLKILQQLFQNWESNQIKSILLYNKLVQRPTQIQLRPHPIFASTLFHQNLWSLMTYYLENGLKYYKIRIDNSRIIDVWYQFLTIQHNDLFSAILSENIIQNSNLGEWFKTQCIDSLFINYFQDDKKLTTLFIVDYFLHGLAFLFYESIVILQKICCKNENVSFVRNKKQKLMKINSIQVNYISKFKL